MFFFYEILAITFLLFSPIIFAVRIIIGKEDFNRFLEKKVIKAINENKKQWLLRSLWIDSKTIGSVNSFWT